MFSDTGLITPYHRHPNLLVGQLSSCLLLGALSGTSIPCVGQWTILPSTDVVGLKVCTTKTKACSLGATQRSATGPRHDSSDAQSDVGVLNGPHDFLPWIGV